LERLQKYLNYLFLEVPSSDDPGVKSWKRVGKSVEWTDTMNATTTTYDYIEDSSPTDELENYKPSVNVPFTARIGDPIYDYAFSLYAKQASGLDAVTRALRVYQNVDAQGANLAQRTDVLITIDSYNIATGVITFTVGQRGTPSLGTAAIVDLGEIDGVKNFNVQFSEA